MINRVKDLPRNVHEHTSTRPVAADSSVLKDRLNLPQIQSFANKHPIAVMAVGLAAGMAFGWWVKRR